jgi:thymidine kinase
MSKGRIEVITGGMFSGKSEELVRRLRRARIAQKQVLAVKHSSDDRYHRTHIGSHTGLTFEAVTAENVAELHAVAPDVDVLGIDEAQFFHPGLVELCESLANQGVRVIVAGLDQDSHGQPFGPIPSLMAVAEEVTKLHAVCVVCGEEASRSYHKGNKTHQVEVGASQYEARCRKCWVSGTTAGSKE